MVANAFDVLMKDYRVAKSNAAARARRVKPVPGFMFPPPSPVVKWPRCGECHRFAPFKRLDARIPEVERGLFTVENNLDGSCGGHSSVVDQYGDGTYYEKANNQYFRWVKRAHAREQAAYEKDYKGRVMKARVAATLSLQQMGVPSGHLVAHIIALSESGPGHGRY
jgi:hypothetical protein